jgi:hypothetical protein
MEVGSHIPDQFMSVVSIHCDFLQGIVFQVQVHTRLCNVCLIADTANKRKKAKRKGLRHTSPKDQQNITKQTDLGSTRLPTNQVGIKVL